ncbi:hypothetical protein BC937DRAFT_89207 [Endogone sp. FLAS-F59071]|nr:hypothetical protein BC937DRAFT_89207 [Endogone sp. FLAS-F59071]|eukprot:RUS18037.1 hypothetical protein BC937DRAFT_89207 [Endogone sp. FLAS-F59071]
MDVDKVDRDEVDRDEVDRDDRVIDGVEIDNDTPLVQVTLNCFLHGDVDGKPFLVKIHKGKTINFLKDAICRKIMLSTVLPKDLDLWKVQIRCSHQDDKFTALNDPSVDIQNTLEGEQMEEVYYVVKPKLSPPTKKRPGYPDETDEELLLLPPTKKTQPKYPGETDEGPDSLMVLSEERIKVTVDYMNKHHAGLLQSPPYTGKSSFGMKLRDHFLSLNEDGIYMSLAGLAGEKEERYDEDLFDAYWEKQTAGISSSARHPRRSLLMNIKAHLSTPNNNLCVLLLATYDLALMPTSTTPIAFDDPLGLDVLRLAEAEFEELVKKYVKMKQVQHKSSHFKIPEEVRKVIYNFTHGHAGICRMTLTFLRDKFADGATTKKMLQYFVSSAFFHRLSGIRALNWVDDWEPTTKEADFLRYALCICDSNSSFNASFKHRKLVKSLSKIGIIVRNSEDRFQFTAPIMQIIMSQRLFTALTHFPDTPSNSVPHGSGSGRVVHGTDPDP